MVSDTATAAVLLRQRKTIGAGCERNLVLGDVGCSTQNPSIGFVAVQRRTVADGCLTGVVAGRYRIERP